MILKKKTIISFKILSNFYKLHFFFFKILNNIFLYKINSFYFINHYAFTLFFLKNLLRYKYPYNSPRYISMFKSYTPFYWSLRVKRNWKILTFSHKQIHLISHLNSSFKKEYNRCFYIKMLIKNKKYYSFLKRRNSLLRFTITLTRRGVKKYNTIGNYASPRNHKHFFLNSFFKKNTLRSIYFNKYLFNYKKKFTKRPVFFKKTFLKQLSENRTIWRFFFFLKFKKEFYLNKFVSTNITTPKKTWLISFEFSLYNTLLRSKLCLTRQQSRDLIKNKFVFLNGVVCISPFKPLNVGDVVQLVYTSIYFFNWRYTYSVLLKASFRLGYCLWRLYRNKGNLFKQRSHHVPQWVNKLMFLKINTPKFLEVDYSILTYVLLRNPINLFEYSVYTIKYFNLYLFRLYNWKYIV